MKNVTKIPPLKHLRDYTGVLAVREGEEMASEDWDTNLAPRNTHVDSLTQLTPRTLEGSVEVEMVKGRVLPYSTNPREGWKASLKGGTAEVLVEDMADLRRIDKSAILDYDGYLPSVSMDRLSKRASFEIGARSSSSRPSTNQPSALLASGPEVEEDNAMLFQLTSFNPEVEEPAPEMKVQESPNQRSTEKSKEADSDDGWEENMDQSRPASMELSSPVKCNEDDISVDIFRTESDIFESPSRTPGKIGIYKGGSFNKGALSPENSFLDRPSFHESFNMEDIAAKDDESVFSLSNANPRFQNLNKEKIHALQQASMASTTDNVIDMPRKLEKAESFVFDNDGVGPEGDFARYIDDDVILDGLAIMKNVGVPNRRVVHSLNLRSAYDGYCSGGEPLYTESMPKATGGNGAICTDYIFFTANSLVASRILSLPPLSQLRGDDPRQPVAVLDCNWSTPPPSLQPYYNRHHTLGVGPEILLDARDASDITKKQAVSKLKTTLRPLLEAETHTEPIFGGFWSYFSSYNPQRTHSWLPNEQFGSSHIAICCEFFVYDDYVAIEWM